MKLWGLGSESLLHFRRMLGTIEAYFIEFGMKLPAQLGMHLFKLLGGKGGKDKRKENRKLVLAILFCTFIGFDTCH